MFLVVRRTRAPEGIPNVIRGAASMTVVVAVSRAVRFANAEVVFACVVASEAAGRALHKIVPAANWTLVCQGNVFVNIERPFRAPAVSAKRARTRSRRRIVSRLPLRRRRQFVREIIQLLSREFGELTQCLDLVLKCQLANIHKPVAVVLLSMNTQRRTNAVTERARCKRVLLREDLYPFFREP